MKNQKETRIYQAKNGAIELKTNIKNESIWASQGQICEIFEVDQSVVSRHIRNIFKDGEVNQKSNMQKMHIANSDKPVNFYSLDVILSVGYRTNSKLAINFRKWATKTLSSHIRKGFTIDKKKISKNFEEFNKILQDLQDIIPKNDISQINSKNLIDLVKNYAKTWLSLDSYDKNTLPDKGKSKKKLQLEFHDLSQDLYKFKQELVKKKQASDLFAREKSRDGFEAIFLNIFASFGGEELYKTTEEKAAHLLYFIIKGHPFNDGNKRSAAFSFIWFLEKAKLLRENLNPETLTLLTIIIAESDRKNKDKMISLILNILL